MIDRPDRTRYTARHGEARMWFLAAAGTVIAVSFVGMAWHVEWIQRIIPFLWLNALAWIGYASAVWWVLSRMASLQRHEQRRVLGLVAVLAILFRVAWLFTTPPALSDDVYRYIWDGRLVNAGVNPYAYPVNSSALDWLDTPLRPRVNHSWMASPYLPAAQAFFAMVYRIAPQSPLAFQIVAAAFDWLTGFLIVDLLRHLRLPRACAVLYLWNPLAVVEFAHGAHVDAWMIFLMMLSLWLLIVRRSRFLSLLALVAATLTKGLTLLLLPLLARRWGWRCTMLFLGLLVATCLPFALDAGWGLTGPLDGTGLFGALRIYLEQWNYNGGIYHWLEVLLSGYWTPGAVPPDVVGWAPILAARFVVGVGLVLVLLAVWRVAQRHLSDLSLLRLAAVPLAAYLLLATTVHPWYVALILPFLPFLPSEPGKECTSQRFLVPALYLAAAVSLSYLTYLDPANPREYDWVRVIEYVPVYCWMAWAGWPAIAGTRRSAAN